MKLQRTVSLILVLLMLAAVLAGCELQETIQSLWSMITDGTTTTTTTTTSTEKPDTGEPQHPWNRDYDIITIAEALELCGEEGNVTTERYYIWGTVLSIDNAQYGAMTIADGTGTISVYGTYSADGSVNYSALEDKPYKGDEVLLWCILQNFNGTKEVKNARLIDFERAPTGGVDPADYTQMSVAEAREAETGEKIRASGVVACITYANGYKPSGVYLVDSTGSIYVYDGDLAARVSVGNQITVLASKTYWVLEDEQGNARKHGYGGCCQLEDATLLENDNEKHDFDTSWITESTVKSIMETPVSENVTTNIYKVTALVSKKVGTGFTNYYFYDLDGKTGTYTYTQCNGGDFAWLDEFDGKICTVYLSPINAKSTTTDCYFRLIPVKVVDEGFEFDLADTPKHVVEYYGLPQFLNTYSGDPKKELVGEISSELLGFEGATLSYSSSDESVISFDVADGKIILRCHKQGDATVTVTGKYGEATYSASISISVVLGEEPDSITVGEAIEAKSGDTVVVKGIVGPSLVNRDGFYLIDETGVIAVTVKNSEVWEGLAVGHEIILTGTRTVVTKGKNESVGQTCIADAEILLNNYGEHDYSTATFITGKTLADIAALDVTEDHSTSVYIVKATVSVTETQYYTSIALADGDTKLTLYSSSANQYSWLKEYAGQEITLEIAPCNWNDKTYYTGCALAVIAEDGTRTVNTLNFTK